MGHASKKPADPQEVFDNEDLRQRILAIGRARAAYEAAREKVRTLKQQLRAAQQAFQRAGWELGALELAVSNGALFESSAGPGLPGSTDKRG